MPCSWTYRPGTTLLMVFSVKLSKWWESLSRCLGWVSRLWENWRGCCRGSSCWAIAKQHTLQTYVRHSFDSFYLHFLNIIRHRPPTETEIEDTLSACCIDNDMLSRYLDATTTILCSHREDVTMYNDIIFKAIFAPDNRIPITLDTNATKAHNVSAWLNDTKFNQLHHVAVGALVMFTSNVNIAKRVVNGATATVTSVHIDNHGLVTTIGVQVIGNSIHIFLKRHNFQHKYTYE